MKKILFAKNLKFLRVSKLLKTKEIPSILDFSPSQWSGYEKNKSYPKFLDLIKIAAFFNVSETDLIHKDLEKSGVSKLSNSLSDDNMLTYLVQLQKEKITSLEFELKQLKNKTKEIKTVNQH